RPRDRCKPESASHRTLGTAGRGALRARAPLGSTGPRRRAPGFATAEHVSPLSFRWTGVPRRAPYRAEDNLGGRSGFESGLPTLAARRRGWARVGTGHRRRLSGANDTPRRKSRGDDRSTQYAYSPRPEALRLGVG